MEYVENINVAVVLQQLQSYKAEKEKLTQKLSQLNDEVENSKRGIHSYDGAIQALNALLQTAESKEIDVPELEEN
jgi:chromosome segregation ATPase